MGYPNTHMRAALFGAIVFASGPGLAGGGGDNLPPVFSLAGAPGQGGTTTASYTPGLGRSSSTASETVKVVGPGFDAAVTVDADASANNHLIGRSTSAVTGGYGGVAGNGSVSVTNTNVAESFLKGSNGISESESYRLCDGHCEWAQLRGRRGSRHSACALDTVRIEHCRLFEQRRQSFGWRVQQHPGHRK